MFPKTWIEAQKLTANEFAKSALTELKAWSGKGTYAELAKLIYRSESTIMTWCAPNSENPLPLHARHHIWLAISALQTAKQKHRRPWTQKDDDYLKEHYHKSTSAELAAALGRSYSAVASREVLDYFSAAVRKRWDNACYSVACDIEANKHYGDKDSLVFQTKLFIKTFFKIKRKFRNGHKHKMLWFLPLIKHKIWWLLWVLFLSLYMLVISPAKNVTKNLAIK